MMFYCKLSASYQLYKDLSYFLITGADIVLFGFCLMILELVGQLEKNSENYTTQILIENGPISRSIHLDSTP